MCSTGAHTRLSGLIPYCPGASAQRKAAVKVLPGAAAEHSRVGKALVGLRAQDEPGPSRVRGWERVSVRGCEGGAAALSRSPGCSAAPLMGWLLRAPHLGKLVSKGQQCQESREASQLPKCYFGPILKTRMLNCLSIKTKQLLCSTYIGVCQSTQMLL